jgi:hypothetical protein
MKKIVRLTESDLVRLIKRVINEQSISGKTLEDFKKWAMNKQNECPEPTDPWDRYCPQGTWKYDTRNGNIRFFSDKNEVVMETTIMPNDDKYNGPVVELQYLANWVSKKNVPYYNGVWKWGGVKGAWSAGNLQSVNLYDNDKNFLGTMTF